MTGMSEPQLLSSGTTMEGMGAVALPVDMLGVEGCGPETDMAGMLGPST